MKVTDTPENPGHAAGSPPAEAAPAEPAAPAAESSAPLSGEAAEAPEAAPPPAEPPPEGGSAEPTAGKTPELSPAACAAQLAERFPALFGPQGPVKPIKLRIQADIQQRAPGVFSRKSLSLFLHRHTTSTAYLKALVAAPSRFDLDGAPAGDIADEHREAARAEVERRRAIVAERRKAEARAARAAQTPAGNLPPGVDAGEPRAPRADRPSNGDAPRRAVRPPRPNAHRPPREDRPPHREPRADVQGPARRDGGGPSAPGRQPSVAPATVHPVLPQDPARRDRALLLRAWESSPLTKSNFCALKRLREPEFDALIEQARQERDAR